MAQQQSWSGRNQSKAYPWLTYFFLLQEWKMTQTTYQVRAAGATPRDSRRNRGRRGQPSRTTSCRPWRSPSRGRSTSASRTAWSWPRNSGWQTRRSKPGTKIDGELLVLDLALSSHSVFVDWRMEMSQRVLQTFLYAVDTAPLLRCQRFQTIFKIQSQIFS